MTCPGVAVDLQPAFQYGRCLTRVTLLRRGELKPLCLCSVLYQQLKDEVTPNRRNVPSIVAPFMGLPSSECSSSGCVTPPSTRLAYESVGRPDHCTRSHGSHRPRSCGCGDPVSTPTPDASISPDSSYRPARPPFDSGLFASIVQGGIRDAGLLRQLRDQDIMQQDHLLDDRLSPLL